MENRSFLLATHYSLLASACRGEQLLESLLAIEQFDANHQGPQRIGTEGCFADLHQVFVRADDERGVFLLRAPLHERFDVAPRVGVVIGKLAERRDPAAATLQRAAKPKRVADAA